MTEPSPVRAFFRRGGPARRYGPLAVLAVIGAILVAVINGEASTGLPLDPRSPDGAGTKALTLILERLDADVDVLSSPDGASTDTLLVLADNLDQAGADTVREFAEDGGTVLVTDPSGLLARDLRPARASSAGFLEPALDRNCDVAALQDVERVRPGPSPMLVVPDGAQGCFGEDDAAWLILQPEGDGVLAVAGGPSFLTNALIADLDNAPLAAALLAPEPGTRVGILRPDFAPAAGPATTSLRDLIPRRLIAAMAQLLIAFLLVVLWRARRLGKPVHEAQQVTIAGSELVVAMGTLFQRTAARQRAAQLLRTDLRSSLSEQLGTQAELAAEHLADIAAQRANVARDDVLRALQGPTPETDAQLVELSQLVESIREAVRTPVPTASSRS